MGELWTAKEICLQIIITNDRILDQLNKCADTIWLIRAKIKTAIDMERHDNEKANRV